MHDTIMAQVGMEHDHHNGPDNAFGGGDGWVEINNGYSSSHQSPIYEHGGGFGWQPMHQQHHSLPSTTDAYARMAPPPTNHHAHHQQLLPLIVPTHPTWPSMLTNPANNHALSAPPVAIPPMSLSGKPPKLPALHATPSPRKTLTDDDRRRMCQYHEDNPSVKQTEIGAMFGVERSTVSKVLRQREKYLFPESGSLSPVKRAKGKFPDIERALSNWVRNTQKQGIPLTDSAIKEKARFFATTVGNSDSHLKTNSTSWLEKFKQKNGIGSGKLARKSSDANMSENGSLNPDSTGPSATQTPISPSSPCLLPSPLSANRSDEEQRTDSLNSYFDFSRSNGDSRHSNSQSTTSLSSVMTDTAPSSFSGGPSSPMTPFAFSPDGSSTNSWMQQQSRLPPPSNSFSRPRSQTFPTIDPAFISQETLTPKFNHVSVPESPAALSSPAHDMNTSFSLDATINSPALQHRSSNGSMAPPSNTNGIQTPISEGIAPSQDDARRALDVLLNFFQQAPTGLVDQNDYMTVIKLTEKLRLPNNEPLPGGLHRINEQECEAPSTKMEGH